MKTEKCKFPEIYTDSKYIISKDDRQIVVLKEKKEKRVFRAVNISKSILSVYRVDGGIISSNKVDKCDYAIVKGDDNIFLIELKGAELSHACQQIISTINQLINPNLLVYSSINARIVLSKVRVPDIKITNEKLLEKLIKKHKGSYIKQCQLLEEAF